MFLFSSTAVVPHHPPLHQQQNKWRERETGWLLLKVQFIIEFIFFFKLFDMGNQLVGIAPSQIFPVEYYLTDHNDLIFDVK